MIEMTLSPRHRIRIRALAVTEAPHNSKSLQWEDTFFSLKLEARAGFEIRALAV